MCWWNQTNFTSQWATNTASQKLVDCVSCGLIAASTERPLEDEAALWDALQSSQEASQHTCRHRLICTTQRYSKDDRLQLILMCCISHRESTNAARASLLLRQCFMIHEKFSLFLLQAQQVWPLTFKSTSKHCWKQMSSHIGLIGFNTVLAFNIDI